MIVPRRVRRRLLLPPGWVALGCILLLGCQALQPWCGQLKRWNVLRLIIMPLKADTSYLRFLKSLSASKVRNEFNPYVTPLPGISTSVLQKLRPWHTVDFSGQRLADFLSAAAVESATRRIIADSGHAGGVRVRFLPGATYTSLVRVLDIMNYTSQKKYFLDIHHYPTTLYAITDPLSYGKPEPTFVCGTPYREPYILPRNVGLREMGIEFWEKLLALVSKPWRMLAVWLVIIGSLSIWRLFWPKADSGDS
jgi:hypothetical protein